MWPVLGAVAGSLLTGMFNQNSANSQMQFQERMRSTQYQTAVEDMRKAGINPMLAYSQGGAGTPSGASATMPDAGNAVSQGIHSAVAAKTVQAQIDNMKADTALKGESAKAAGASALASMANADLASQNSATVAAMRPSLVEKAFWDAGTAGSMFDASLPGSTSGKMENSYLQSPLGKFLRMMSFGATDAGKAINAGSSALALIPHAKYALKP